MDKPPCSERGLSSQDCGISGSIDGGSEPPDGGPPVVINPGKADVLKDGPNNPPWVDLSDAKVVRPEPFEVRALP